MRMEGFEGFFRVVKVVFIGKKGLLFKKNFK